MNFWIFIIVMFAFITGTACAEIPLSVNLKVHGAYVDNLFQTSTPDSDYISLTNFDASYDFNAMTSVLYNFDVNLFNKYTDLHSQTHYIGIDHEKSINDKNGTLYFGGGIGLRDNALEYFYYDYRSAGVYSSLKYHLTQTILAKAEYQMEYEDHQSYEDFSSLENYGSIQIGKSFNTRTTIQTRFEVGRRDYVNIGNDISKVTGYIKIAQSLTDLTGLQLQYIWHRVSETFQYPISLQDNYYLIEDPDDEYSYSGTKLQLVLKHYAPWNLLLKGTISRDKRSYSALTSDGQERNDTNTIISFGIEKKLLSREGFMPDVSLYMEFLHKDTKSSDLYYESSTNMFFIGTGMSF